MPAGSGAGCCCACVEIAVVAVVVATPVVVSAVVLEAVWRWDMFGMFFRSLVAVVSTV